MKNLSRTLCCSLVLVSTALSAGAAHAHGAEDHDVPLHVGNEFDDCYFDLHPELTKAELKEFASEAGQIIYFRPVSSADTLGTLNFDLSLGASVSGLDDGKGAWNNTMSHPEKDHYLGTQLRIPQLTLRAGVSENIDVETYATWNPTSNYGFVGVATKLRLLNQKSFPVSLAVRPHLSALVGPEEVTVGTGGADVLVSRSFFGLAPFLGVGANVSVAAPHSDDVDLDPNGKLSPVVLGGLDYNWKVLSVGAQVEYSRLAIASARIGARF